MNDKQLGNCIKLLCEVQEATLGPAWYEQDNDYGLAAVSELTGEYLQSVQWEWWKKKTPDLVNARVELVDAFHFMLAGALRSVLIANHANKEHAIQTIIDSFSRPAVYPIRGVRATEFTPLKELVIRMFCGEVDFHGFRQVCLMHVGGMDTLYVPFLKKAALNKFRTLNGYKDGTYIKTWATEGGKGVEDNVVVSKMSFAEDTTPEQAAAMIEAAYAKVPKPANTGAAAAEAKKKADAAAKAESDRLLAEQKVIKDKDAMLMAEVARQKAEEETKRIADGHDQGQTRSSLIQDGKLEAPPAPPTK